MIKSIKDIQNFSDLDEVAHYKAGDRIPDGIIKEIVYVDDPVVGKSVVFFFTNGVVGGVKVELS